ncbi:MAG: GNAT family protein [Flavobacteriales bacterium]
MVFTGSRLQLDVVALGDESFMFDWENNPENWAVSEGEGPYTLSEIRQFITTCDDLIEHHQIRFVVRQIQNQIPIGAFDFFNFDAKSNKVGLGILIADKSDRKKGYASECLTEHLPQMMQYFNLSEVYALVFKDNIASIRLFEKCGFTVQRTTIYKNKSTLVYTFKR